MNFASEHPRVTLVADRGPVHPELLTTKWMTSPIPRRPQKVGGNSETTVEIGLEIGTVPLPDWVLAVSLDCLEVLVLSTYQIDTDL